jgi:hypothetical protein
MTCQTAAEALAAWDAGEIVTTVELGGLGPGYEQAIQVLSFEIIRDALAANYMATDENIKQLDMLADATVHRIDSMCGGFSGAQVGAAKWLAYRTLRDGWGHVIAQAAKKDQTTMVSRTWPNVPVPITELHKKQ